MIMRIVNLVVTGAIILVLSAGCIGEDEDPKPTTWNEREIVNHMDLTPSSSGLSWTFRTDNGTTCNVAVVMTNANQVALYKNAGDTVATNEDGTAGVKITGGESRTCSDAAENLLKDL